MSLEQQLGNILLEKQQTICTAESCTGGLIASRITDVSGSSTYMLGGIVAYSNAIKERLLKVQTQTLIDYGAVSEKTAGEMARGAWAALGTDYAISVTGIAGPGGGTAEKPVGLVYIGLAGPDDLLVVERHIWPHDRQGNKIASADAGLALAIRVLTAE